MKSFFSRLQIGLLLLSLGSLVGFGWALRFRLPSPSLSPATTEIPANITLIARQVTVRVLRKVGSGSGVIVGRKGTTYTVLTCKHVIAGEKQADVTVFTYDGEILPAELMWIAPEGLDLAMLSFDSSHSYSPVKLNQSPSPKAGELLFASGFPNYVYQGSDSVQDTRNWGRRAFRLEPGRFEFKLLSRSLEGGYQLGSTNDVEIGMSGGPLLNARGELVGINGRAKYPIQGSEAYIYNGGGQPPDSMIPEMESLSWAIPISTWHISINRKNNQN